MKKIGIFIAALVCICLVLGGFYYVIDKNKTAAEDNTKLTEVDKVITKDLDKSYPKTPREVVKFYNRIISCYYANQYSDDQFEKLIEQAMKLLDEELVANNEKERYMLAVKNDVEKYVSESKTISQSNVCASNDVTYKTIDGKECAFVMASYFIKEGSSYSKTFQQYVLRKDDKGRWKILGYEKVQGDFSDYDLQ